MNGDKIIKIDEVDEETLNSGAEGYVLRYWRSNAHLDSSST